MKAVPLPNMMHLSFLEASQACLQYQQTQEEITQKSRQLQQTNSITYLRANLADTLKQKTYRGSSFQARLAVWSSPGSLLHRFECESEPCGDEHFVPWCYFDDVYWYWLSQEHSRAHRRNPGVPGIRLALTAAH